MKTGHYYQRIACHKGLSAYEDRKKEVLEYFGDDSFVAELLKQQSLASREYKDWMYSKYFSQMNSDSDLFASYKAAAKAYILRHMLGRPEKLDSARNVINHIAQAGNTPDNRILDYGCGVGDFSLLFASFGFEVHSCELDTEMIDFAASRFSRRGLKGNFHRLTPENLYFKSDFSFDCVFCRDVLEHIREPLRVVKNIYAMLKPGGLFYTSTLSPGSQIYTGGTHLPDALRQAQTSEYAAFWRSSFYPIPDVEGLYIKLPKIVAVEGILGAGKSTLIRALAQENAYGFVNLPITRLFNPDFTNLTVDYQNSEYYLYLDQLKRTMAIYAKKPVVLLERHSLSTLGHFWAANGQKEDEAFNRMCAYYDDQASNPIAAWIFLDLPWEHVRSRLQQRGQNNVAFPLWLDESHVEGMRQFYRNCAGRHSKGIPSLMIDATQSAETIKQQAQAFLSSI